MCIFLKYCKGLERFITTETERTQENNKSQIIRMRNRVLNLCIGKTLDKLIEILNLLGERKPWYQ